MSIMANGWIVACSSLMYLAVAAIVLYNVGWKTSQCMDFNMRFSVTMRGRGLSLFWEKFRPTLPSFDLNSRHHLLMQKTSEVRVFSLQSKSLPKQCLESLSS